MSTSTEGIGNYSEEYRHECEVRTCVRQFWPSKSNLDSHIKTVKSCRGELAAARLKRDVDMDWTTYPQKLINDCFPDATKLAGALNAIEEKIGRELTAERQLFRELWKKRELQPSLLAA